MRTIRTCLGSRADTRVPKWVFLEAPHFESKGSNESVRKTLVLYNMKQNITPIMNVKGNIAPIIMYKYDVFYHFLVKI